MKNFKLLTILTFVLSVFVLSGCKKDDPKLDSPEAFLKNPYVSDAVNESNIPVNQGNNPPALAGTYSTNGSVTDASDELSSLIGNPIQSVFVLSNQTASGKIDFAESVSGINVSGIGGYITGDNGRFTIYGESKQSGTDAGLPDGISLTVVIMMSGTQSNNGNLTGVQGISIITDAASNNSSYNVAAIKGLWWKYNATFTLQKSNAPALKSSVNYNGTIIVQKTLQNIIK